MNEVLKQLEAALTDHAEGATLGMVGQSEALTGYASEMVSTYLIAEDLVIAWDQVKTEFTATKTLENKNPMIAMMYQP